MALTALNVFSVPRYGVDGASLAVLIATTFWSAWLWIAARQHVGFDASILEPLLPVPAGRCPDTRLRVRAVRRTPAGRCTKFRRITRRVSMTREPPPERSAPADGASAVPSGGPRIVPCTRDRMPEIVELLRDDPRPADAVALAESRRYFEQVYFDSPWFDPEIAPLICEDRDGRIEGFLGVVARPMAFEGRPVRVAASSNFFVRSDERQHRNPLVAVRLLKTFFAGPQDLSLADGAGLVSKRIWERCGGSAMPLYSFDWFRPLRPVRGLLELLQAMRARALPFTTVLRLLAGVTDVLGSRVIRGVVAKPLADVSIETLEEGFVPDAVRQLNDVSLRPRYDAKSFAWLLRMGKQRSCNDDVRACVVRDHRRHAIGWFVYFLERDGVAFVLQLLATSDDLGIVLQAAIQDATARGLALLRGAVDPRDLQSYRENECLVYTGRWMLVQSRRPELLEPFRLGTALVTCFDGERWIRGGRWAG